jgi:predicted outer membrane protein
MTSRQLIFLAALLIALPSLAAPKRASSKKTAKAPATPAPLLSTELDGGDILFLKSAAECAALIVQLGEFGMARATMPEIRGLGEIVAQNYAHQAGELRALAGRKKVFIAAGSVRADAPLRGLKGLKFDKVLVEQLVKIQGRALEAFEQAGTSHDADVRAFVRENISKVRTQFIVARRIIGESGPSATPPPATPSAR